ncbi:hypothetical protein CL614_02485 [archaeon]|nr:hypothetical protein [archaeon]|tara:strand:+ start:75 stop:548 length:474 start_codon:yes stop_codon:yes gene_type:complete
MEIGDRAWGIKMIKDLIDSINGGYKAGMGGAPPVGGHVIKYIKDNSVLNEGREILDELPVGFSGFFFSEEYIAYFGFVNLDRPSQSFYMTFRGGFEDTNLYDMLRKWEIYRKDGWGENPQEWNVNNFWDITDLVMGGIKRGLFINWPLDPPRIGDGV